MRKNNKVDWELLVDVDELALLDFADEAASGREAYKAFSRNPDSKTEFGKLLKRRGVSMARRLARKALKRRGMFVA